MNMTVVSPTGTKINKMPVMMLPQTSMFLANNRNIQDLSLKDKLNELSNFMSNFDLINFYEGLESNPVAFINSMVKKEAFSNSIESMDLFVHILETVSNNHTEAVEKINGIREEMAEEMHLPASNKKIKKAKNEQRPTLKPSSGDNEEDPKNKHKFESPKLKMM